MQRLSLFALIPAACLPLHAEPIDGELLKYVQERAIALEQFCIKPVDMQKLTAFDCRLAPPAITRPENPHTSQALIFGTEDSAIPYADPFGEFPVGSVLLKEKLGKEDGKTELFTGMVKREEGYFPEGGDWEYFVVDGTGTNIQARGKLQRCASCHEDYRENDYVTRLVFTPRLQLRSGRIILHAASATPHGTKLTYERNPKKNTLGFWTETSDWASWTFEVTQPGKYAIHLWQGCGTGSGGSEVEVTCASQTLRFKVEETGHFQNFKERTLGEIHLDQPGHQTLEVRALFKPGLAVMDLPRIVLQPVTP